MSEGAPSGPVRVQEWRHEGTGRPNLGQGERLASAIGGGVLALWGLSRLSLSGLALALGGGALIYRGLLGRAVYERLGMDSAGADDAARSPSPIDVALTVARPRAVVYTTWRAFENFPRFMRHLQSVTQVADRRYRFVARMPHRTTVEWDVELVEDRENELIAWQSLPGSGLHNTGWVSFRDAPQDGATDVYVEILIRPSGGEPGAILRRWLAPAARDLIQEDIRRFKPYVEAVESERQTYEG